MDHVKEFFRQFSDETPRGNFHRVIALHEAPDVDWEAVNQLVPKLCKGWYELAHLPSKDRIEFVRDFWLDKLPYQCGFSEFIVRFFDNLDDIGIYLTQQKFDDPVEADIVYCLKDNSGFFRGGIPASEEDLTLLQKQFPDYILPADYKAFLSVHNGFRKSTDVSGIAASHQMEDFNTNFQQLLAQQENLLTTSGKEVNPNSLIAFYQSFGMPFFQCFWGEWYPAEEMGNVYYSGTTKTITYSDDSDPNPENMAFPTFLHWLMFYLEQIA